MWIPLKNKKIITRWRKKM